MRRPFRVNESLIAGIYAWSLTVAPLAIAADVPTAARLSALLAGGALVASAALRRRSPASAAVVGIPLVFALCVLTWLLGRLGGGAGGAVSPISPVRLDPARGLFGALGWLLYGVTWGNTAASGPFPKTGSLYWPPAELVVAGVFSLLLLTVGWGTTSPTGATLAQSCALAASLSLLAIAAHVSPPTSSRAKRRRSAVAVPLSDPHSVRDGERGGGWLKASLLALAGGGYTFALVSNRGQDAILYLVALLSATVALSAASNAEDFLRRAALKRRPPAPPWVALLLVTIFAGCEPSPIDGKGGVGGAAGQGVLARVRGETITAEDVLRIAQAQRINPQAGLQLAIRERLWTVEAREWGADRWPAFLAARRGVLARATLEALRAQAAFSPIIDSEVEEATARHFVDLDRPEAFRVIHAVAMASEEGGGTPPKLVDGTATARRIRAKDLAEKIRAALSTLSRPRNAEAFRAQAGAVEHDGLEVKIEELQPVAADGRVTDRLQSSAAGQFSPRFAQAASDLQQPGDVSPVVATEFGYHVMMLLERIEGYHVALEDRRHLLHDEILTQRTRTAVEKERTRLRQRVAPTVERTADAIFATLTPPP